MRHPPCFLTDRSPVAAQIAGRLLGEIRGPVLDLSDTLLLLPTANAARRVREALARQAAARGRGVLSPLALPSGRFSQFAFGPACATPQESRMAWVRTVTEAPPALLAPLVPLGLRSATAAAGLAEALLDAVQLLADSGRSPRDVTDLGDVEPDRWQSIAALAGAHAARLESAGLESPEIALARWVAAPVLPDGIRRVILAGVPDPAPTTLAALERLAGPDQKEVEVGVFVIAPGFSPQALAAFDAWGRPDPAFWTREPLPPGDAALHVAADPGSLAERALDEMALALGEGAGVGLLAPDPDLIPWMIRACERRGLTGFDPAGDPASRFAGAALLRLACDAQADPAIDRIAAVLRHPAVLARLSAHADLAPEDLLAAFDRMRSERLPIHLDAARALVAGSALGVALDSLAGFLGPVGRGPGAQFRAWLAWGWPAGGEGLDADEVELLRSHLDAWSAIRFEPGPDALNIAVQGIERERLVRRSGDSRALEISGWLEGPWEASGRLIVCGLHEGAVPEQVQGHLFLPESLRRRVGLPTNADRHARDAYLLQAVCGARGPGGVTVFVARTGSAGDPVRPSRLLLQVAREHLPARVRRLFAPAGPARRQDPWTAAWPLRIPAPIHPPERLRVTDFRDYLSHPLAFHLRRVLKMEEVEARPSEMGPAAAGSLFHELMREMADDLRHAETTDGPALAHWLEERLEARLSETFGGQPGVPLLAQRSALRKRLRAAARVHTAEISRGWRIASFETEINGALTLDGIPVVGRMDRIDRAPDGALRVLDYKTSAGGTDPAKAHWTAHRGDTGGWPAWRLFERRGRLHRWNDLQLPLYLLAARQLHPEATRIDAGYFLVPEEPDGTGIELIGLSDEDLAAAWRCAEGILSELSSGRIAPAPPRADAREFERILFSGLEGTVEVVA